MLSSTHLTSVWQFAIIPLHGYGEMDDGILEAIRESSHPLEYGDEDSRMDDDEAEHPDGDKELERWCL